MINSNNDYHDNLNNSENHNQTEESPTFQDIDIESNKAPIDKFVDYQQTGRYTSPPPKIPNQGQISKTVGPMKPNLKIFHNYTPSLKFSSKQQINLQHVIKGNKNLNIVILHTNSPKNSPLSNAINTQKENVISDVEADKLKQIESIEKKSPSIKVQDDLEEYYHNNHPFYTSGMKAFQKINSGKLKKKNYTHEKNICSEKMPDSSDLTNKDEFSEKNISENEIKPRISIIDREGNRATNRILRTLSENSFITRNIVKDDITELNENAEEEKTIDKEANGIASNRNLENVKVIGLGGPASFNFDPKQVRRYKRKDLNKGKLYFKYRYVTEKLIETNNLGEEKMGAMKFSDNKNTSVINYSSQNDDNNNCYFYSSDDKNVIKFTCLFLRKIEKAIFIFNMKKYNDSLNYLKESKIIKNEEEFAEILLTFSGFNKYTIGEFLSKEKSPNENNKITKYFIYKMDFEGEYFLDSFRYLLSRINLPKDSGLILNLIDVFTDSYFKDNLSKEQAFADVLAVYLMASTILAINTIFHTKIQNANIPLISKEDFKSMNKGVKADLVEKIYDEIRVNKLDIIHDYNELIYRRLEVKSEEIITEDNRNKKYGSGENENYPTNYPDKILRSSAKNEKGENYDTLNGEEMLKMLKSGEVFQIYSNSYRIPEDKLVHLSMDEKLILLKPISCTCLNREKSIHSEKLINVYIGTSNSQQFDKSNIAPEFELNCLSIIGVKISLGIHHENTNIIKSWYKALKFLIKRAKSAWEVEKKKIKELTNRKEIVSDFWRTEILPNWSHYRNYLLVKGDLNCQIRFFTNDEIYKKFTDSVVKRSKLSIEEKEKGNVVYLWFLGIPEWLRKKLWSLVISNNLSINENLFNYFLMKNEEIEFYGDTAIDRKNILDAPKNQKDLKVAGELENTQIYNKQKAFEPGYNHFENPLLNEIILDINKSFKKFENAIKDANIEENTYKEDIFKTLRIFTNYRPDINYSRSIAYIATILYLNSEDFYNAFILCCNFIIPSILIKFLTKDEVFIRYRIQFFNNLIKTYAPTVSNHFKNLDISLDLFFYDWVEYLFSKTFSYESTLRIWDCYLVKGEIFIYEVALAIIKLQEQDIVNVRIYNDLCKSTVRGILSNLCNFPSKYTEDELFEKIEKLDITNEYNLLIEQNNLAGEKIELYAAFLDN